MTGQSVYRGTAERDGRFWFIRIDGIGATQARRLDQVQEMATDLVADMTEQDPEDVLVAITPIIDPKINEAVARAVAASARGRIAQLEGSIAMREAAEALTGSGLTVRDAAALLGLSFQRVSQLLADDEAPDKMRDRLSREVTKADDPRTEVLDVRQPVSA